MNENCNLILKEGEELQRSDKTVIHVQEQKSSIPKDIKIEEKDYPAWNGCCMWVIAWIFFPIMCPTFLILCGLFTVNENEVAIITINGVYAGLIKTPGFYWVNGCFTHSVVISLRQRNSASDILHVNDKQGNPLEIKMNMVWRIEDPLKLYKIQNYQVFVKLQSEGALKELASYYPYDSTNPDEHCLLRDLNQINIRLRNELCERLAMAGIVCDEASLVHIHYPPEIAKMLLKKQEAEALIAAKDTITKGVVIISQNCIKKLEETIKLSPQVKTEITNELIMILCDTIDEKDKNTAPSQVCLSALR